MGVSSSVMAADWLLDPQPRTVQAMMASEYEVKGRSSVMLYERDSSSSSSEVEKTTPPSSVRL